jgi:hypothetical protein
MSRRMGKDKMSKKSKLALAAKKFRPIKSYFATKIPTTPDDSGNPTPNRNCAVEFVDVRLLPDTTLTARYNGGRLGLDDAIASAIEDVGFGATLTSRQDVSADDDRSRWSAEDGGPRGDSRTKKVLHLSLAAGKQELALVHLRKFEGVSDARCSRPRVARDDKDDNAPNRNCAIAKDPPEVFGGDDDQKP